MEKLAYYVRSKEPWVTEEDSELLKEYNDAKLDVSQIADIHKRTPGGIAHRLKKLEQIPLHIEARGYQVYQTSDLYREIVSNGENDRKNRKEAKNTIVDNSEDLKEYSYTGTSWSAEESATLFKEYNEDKLTLLEICKLRKRLPKDVIFKIRSMNLEQYQGSIRGYYEYKDSSLYKQVRKEKRDEFAKKKTETNIVNARIQKKQNANLELEISELKDEMDAIKNELIVVKATLYDIQQALKVKNIGVLVNSNKDKIANTKSGNLVNANLR